MSRGKNASQQRIYEVYRQLDDAFLPALKHLAESSATLNKSIESEKKAFAEYLQTLFKLAVSGKGASQETEKTADELQQFIQTVKKINAHHAKLGHTFSDLAKRIQNNAGTEKEIHRKALADFIKQEKQLTKDVTKKRKTKSDLATFYNDEEQRAIKLQRSRYSFFLNKHQDLLSLYAEYVDTISPLLEEFTNNQPTSVSENASRKTSVSAVNEKSSRTTSVSANAKLVTNNGASSHKDDDAKSAGTTTSPEAVIVSPTEGGTISKYLAELKNIDNLESPIDKGVTESPLSQRAIVVNGTGTVNSTRSILKNRYPNPLEKIYLPPQEEIDKPIVVMRTKRVENQDDGSSVVLNPVYEPVRRATEPTYQEKQVEQPIQQNAASTLEFQTNQAPQILPELLQQQPQVVQQNSQPQIQYVSTGGYPYNPQFAPQLVYPIPPQFIQVNPAGGWQIPYPQGPSVAPTPQPQLAFVPTTISPAPQPAPIQQQPPLPPKQIQSSPLIPRKSQQTVFNKPPAPLPRPSAANDIIEQHQPHKNGFLQRSLPQSPPQQQPVSQVKQVVHQHTERPMYTAADYGAMMIVIMSYETRAERHISLELNDHVELIKSGERGWVLVRTYDNPQRTGWYPAKFVRRATVVEQHKFVNNH